jgi:alkaline phosphatase
MRNRTSVSRYLYVCCLLLAIALAPCCRAQPAVSGVRNVILMVSDGCGFNHVAAASLFRTGRPEGEIYQSFPVRLAASTFPSGGSYDPTRFWQGFDYAKQGTTDSAAAATALACGVKTRNGYLGVDARGGRVRSLVEVAERSGRATGLVTSVPFSHATPAAFACHEPGRGDYAKIAQQMLAESAVDVILSAGNPWYDDDGQRLATPKYDYLSEAQWLGLQSGRLGGDADGDGRPDPWRLLQTRDELLGLLHTAAPGRVLGLAQAASTLQESRSSPADNPAATALPFTVPFSAGVPSLPQLSQAALSVLAADRRGFFLMIEGGAVDWAAHGNQTGRMIEEQVDFGDAVAAVVRWVETRSNWEETLLIVTADHETGCLTGPGSGPEWDPLVNHGRGRVPGLEWRHGGHTNSLVPVYARGAGAERLRRYADQQDPVRGPYLDNTEISRVMRSVLRKTRFSETKEN